MPVRAVRRRPQSFRIIWGFRIVTWGFRLARRCILPAPETRPCAWLVTTQKDAVNLCEAARELVAPLPLYWLEIGMKIDREEEFLRAVERILESAPAGR